MKKLVLSTIAVFLAMILNAQISVWDGTAEPWTHGNGTQEDPYLIENARQLAYLAVVTNELHYGNYDFHNMYVDTCFLLTVDLDLGGNDGLEWVPVAQDGVSLQTRCFGGNFDGGGHMISNMNLKDGEGRKYMGLFGHVKEGSIKNITIVGNNIDVPDFGLSGISAGLGNIIGYGEKMVVENCKNNVGLICEYAHFEMGGSFGGLFGRMINSTITDCQNYGNMEVREVVAYYGGLHFGGICGQAYDCEINNCSNNGGIFVQSASVNNPDMMSCGGVSGFMSGAITYCYNTGDIDMVIADGADGSAAATGGLVGSTMAENGLSVTNSYSSSDMAITGDGMSVFIGGVIGYVFDDAEASVTNSYYLNVIESINGYGIPKSENEMQSQSFVNLLNDGSNVYAMDDMYMNHGYPIFAQYYSAEENLTDNVVSVYPNPAKNIINISFSDDADCNSIEVYSLDGRLVETCHDTSIQTVIDLSFLNAGVYVIKLKMSDGEEFSKRIVKE